MSESSKIEIKTGVSTTFLEDILTKDISTLEAVYDLVDNSIDAARNSLFAKGENENDSFGLPKSYAGYKVYIKISDKIISIEDNCSGMSEETLVNEAFMIAQDSKHKFGIGQYGVGLKRSLLKMGERYHISIDNSKENYQANVTNEQIGSSKNKIFATKTVSNGTPKALFSVTQLNNETKKDITNKRWLENAINGLQDRYSIYFSKGFEIAIEYLEGEPILLQSRLPSLRTDGEVLPNDLELNIDGVNIFIQSGIHENYYLTSESAYCLSENKKLTDEFGIYFICNDRVIIKASDSKNHGWKTKWHSEYNGFICLVYFVSEDPSKLPWNTAKSAMREDASIFLDVVDYIQPIADNYRTEIKSRYPRKKRNKPNTQPNASQDNDDKELEGAAPPSIKGSSTPTLRPVERLHKDREKFVDWSKAHTRVPSSHQKAYDIYFELCRLNSKNTPIACLAMLRVFIERTIKDTLIALQLSNNGSLNKKTQTVADKLYDDSMIDQRVFDLMQKYTSNNLFSINMIQDLMHSKESNPTHSSMNTYWDDLDPFLAACWKAIAEK